MLKWNRGAAALAVLGMLVALLVAGTASRVSARAESPTVNHLTFAAPVALPGVTLGAGEYSFRVNYVDSGNAVQVRHRESNRLVFLGFTERVQRPLGVASGTVRLGEAAAGEAAPVLVWFPSNMSLGFRFLHSEGKR